MSTILITGGHVLPTASAAADLPSGDVLVTDGVITAVAAALPGAAETADDVIDARGKIVIPGLIDTHRHLWETILRSALPDGDLMDYFNAILYGRGQFFTPADVYASNLLGACSALYAGITTLL